MHAPGEFNERFRFRNSETYYSIFGIRNLLDVFGGSLRAFQHKLSKTNIFAKVIKLVALKYDREVSAR